MLNSNGAHDLTFQTGQGPVTAHAHMLMDASPVLKAMLESSMKEGTTQCIDVKDSSSQGVTLLLQMIYTCSSQDEPSYGTFLEALDLAHRWQVTDAVSIISQALSGMLEPKSFPSIAEAAVLKGLEGLKTACRSFARTSSADSTAEPTTSLVAAIEGRVVGHILFSTARLEPEQEVKAAILAPLAVLPEVQSKGIGGQLIRAGLQALEAEGTALVFVLGHPTYYPKHGFKPAGALGFEATYPIEEKNADAWMVQALAGASPSARGRVQCCAALDRKELWAE
eukprot:s2269_g5.t1